MRIRNPWKTHSWEGGAVPRSLPPGTLPDSNGEESRETPFILAGGEKE